LQLFTAGGIGKPVNKQLKGKNGLPYEEPADSPEFKGTPYFKILYHA